MRTVLTITAAAALLVVALPAQAVPDSPAESLTIRLISVTTQVRLQKDVEPKQVASKGDVIWQKSILRNAVAQFGKPKGALVGSDTGTITLLSTTLVDNKGVTVLPGGTLRFAGRSGGDVVSLTLPVTGGTGRYAGATGKLEVRALNASGSRTTNVYRLTLP